MGKVWEQELSKRQQKLSKQQIERLLKPIHPKNPVGENLHYSDTYDRIRDARFSEDKNIPRGVWVRPLKESDWDLVEKLCVEALTNATKDLQIAAWLLEAWFNKYQLWGLLHGLRLLKELQIQFWDEIYPRKDEDPEYRLAPFEWLNHKFSNELMQIYLTFPESSEYKAYTYGNYRGIVKKTPESKASKQHLKQQTVSHEDFKTARNHTSFDYFQNLLKDLKACQTEALLIEQHITKNFKEFPGYLSKLKADLEQIEQTVTSLAKECEPKPSKTLIQSTLDKLKPAFTGNEKTKNNKEKSMSQQTPLSSRQQAYEQLKEIADFLAKLEPHSPTPYLIRKAVTWGEMTLAEVLNEISKEGGDILKIMKLLGIDSTPKEQTA